MVAAEQNKVEKLTIEEVREKIRTCSEPHMMVTDFLGIPHDHPNIY